MSVGSHPDMNLDATLAERWDGTAWTIQSTPNPPGTYRELAAISCPSATACTAVGHSFEEPGFVQRTLAEAWDGTRWWIQPTPDLPSHASLEGVSCTSDAACTAVGSYYDPGSATYATLAERWDGAAWTIQPTPNPSANSGLNAVSCTSETACTAVGSSGSPGTTLAEAWDGASWSIEPMPSPQGEARLNGVSCPSATACTATGQYYDLGSGTYFTLAEGWDGAAWQIQPTPTPAHGATLAGVSCASSSACIAVGNYSLQGYGSGGPLAERWDGTAWTMELPIVPPGVKNASLAGVSCTAPTECIATGSYTPYYPGPSPTGTLAERYSG